MTENLTVVPDDSTPSLLKRLPKKKIALAATAVIVTVAVGVLLKNRVDVDIDTVVTPA